MATDMDEATRRGLGWKIAFKTVHAQELDLFREYISIVHAALDGIHASHVVQVARKVAAEPDEEQKQYIEMYHAEDDSKFGVALPAMSSAAMFVSILSYLEHEMCSLCARLQKNRNRSLRVKDLSGSGIEQAANYLEKVCGADGLTKNQTWRDVSRLQKLRNIIVHRRGVLREVDGKNDPDREMRTYAMEKGLLADPCSVDIVLSQEFCLEAIESVQSMLWIIVDRVPTADMGGDRAGP